MKITTISLANISLWLGIAILATGCDARYQIVGNDSVNNNGILNVPTGPIPNCSPTSINIPPVPGLGGSLYVDIASSEANFATMVQNGTLQNKTVMLTDLDVPTTWYTIGFPLSNGQSITDDGNNLLQTNYALDMTSNLVLGPNDPDGDYQIATLADDGINVLLIGPNNSRTTCRSIDAWSFTSSGKA